MDIGKSKQLLNKTKTRNKGLPRSSKKLKNSHKTPRRIESEGRTASTPKLYYNANSNLLKFCSNSKPMPSLAELEKMYDGSDNDELPPLPSKPKSALKKSQEDQSTAPAPEVPDRCKTPDNAVIIDLDKLRSPTTVRDISKKMLDFIENLPDTTDNFSENQPLSVIPPKKRKKTEVPYIVGCKDRPQLSNWVSSAVIGAGDPKYGIELNDSDEEDLTSPKRQKKSNVPTPQHSHFNAQAEEIAAKLKVNEALSDASDESAKTVSYEFMRTFSPEPSTSRDKEVFLKNEIRLNESLKKEMLNNSKQSDVDVEIIEEPRITITIDDDVTNSNDSGVQIVDLDVKEVKPTPNVTCIDLLGDDPYSSITNIDSENDSDCEVINIDDVLAGHQSVLQKYKRDNTISAVTFVDPTPIVLDDSHNAQKNNSQLDNNATVNKPKPKNNLTVSDVSNNKPHDLIEENEPTDYVGYYNPNCPSKKYMEIITNFLRRMVNPQNEEVHRSSSGSIQDLSQSPEVANLLELTSSLATSYQNPNTTIRSPSNRERESSRVVIASPQNLQTPAASIGLSSPGISQNIQPLRANTRNRARQKKNQPAAIVVGESPICSPSVVCYKTSQQTLQNVQGQASSLTYGPHQSTFANIAIAHGSSLTSSPQSAGRRIGECPICMENLSNKSIASTVCGHIFCTECIKAAVKSGGKKCPTCRKKLTGIGYHQIFL